MQKVAYLGILLDVEGFSSMPSKPELIQMLEAPTIRKTLHGF